MLRFIGSVSDLPLLTIGDYYYTYDKMMERKMVTGKGYGMGIGECNKLCPTVMGLRLVALFSLSVSIEDRQLYWTLVKSLIIRGTYLLMGAEMLVTILSWIPSLSGPTDWRPGKVEV
jgi:hypothetical protein